MDSQKVSVDQGGPLVRINCHDLARVIPFRARDDVRYYLEGVHVEPVEGGCILVATDGHRLGAIRSSSSQAARPVIVRATNQLADLVRTAAYDAEVIVDDEKGRARIVHDGVEKFVQAGEGLIDGKFPEWRRVIPPQDELTDGLPGAVSAAYLKSMVDIAASTGGFRGGCIYFQYRASEAENGVIVMRYGDEPELVMALMPMHFERQPMPAWVR